MKKRAGKICSIKNEKEPLYCLLQALCNNNLSQLFHDQVVMYRGLIPFICDDLVGYSNIYAPVSVDDLISDIRRYIEFLYENPGKGFNSSTNRPVLYQEKNYRGYGLKRCNRRQSKNR